MNIRNRNPKIEIQKSKSKNRNPKIEIQKSKSKNRNPKIEIQKSIKITVQMELKDNVEIPKGLYLCENFITEEEETELVRYIDSQPWSHALSRRTQHYGYEYNYKSRKPAVAPPLDGKISSLRDKLISVLSECNIRGCHNYDDDGNIIDGEINDNIKFDQCIVNEYTRDQGIGVHTDSPIFGPIIISVSLLSPTKMIFKKSKKDTSVGPNKSEPLHLVLNPRSLMVMSGESRSDWTHEIPRTKSIALGDGKILTKGEDYRRISLTYRVQKLT